MSHFDFSKIVRGFDKISSFELEDVNVATKNKLIKERLLPLLQSHNVNLTYDELTVMEFQTTTLLTLTDLVNALNQDTIQFVSNDIAKKDNEILLSLIPTLVKIDNINTRYDGKPPAKYFSMTTYMSNEEMYKLGLTNEERTFYIKTLFNSKVSTMDIPVNLRPYISTNEEQHKLIYKRRIPMCLEKEFWFFFVKFYTTDKKKYPRVNKNQNNAHDLENEFYYQLKLLNQFT